jgi:adenylate cyclase
MPVDDRTRIAVPLILKIVAIGAVAGAAYSYFTTAAAGGPPVYGLVRGLLSGAIIGGLLSSLNIFVLEAPSRHGGARRAPFLAHVAIKSVIYLIVFLFGAWIGQRVVPVRGFDSFEIGLGDFLYFIAISFVVNFLFDLNSLLGQNVLLDFVSGRYFQPRVEQRILLMIDMRNSTAAAERLGEVDFHRLLNRFISDLTGPIVIWKGQIHKYVGDELIVTWPLAVGLKQARCLRACFGAIRRLAELGPTYESEFGLSVNLRAALHCGPLVVGEMGTIKKEIALIGDTMNTTARIVDACREHGELVIASASLLRQLTTIPSGVDARPLGPIQMRGKGTPVELFALNGAAAEPSPAA